MLIDHKDLKKDGKPFYGIRCFGLSKDKYNFWNRGDGCYG